jgi:hypothetical protein
MARRTKPQLTAKNNVASRTLVVGKTLPGAEVRVALTHMMEVAFCRERTTRPLSDTQADRALRGAAKALLNHRKSVLDPGRHEVVVALFRKYASILRSFQRDDGVDLKREVSRLFDEYNIPLDEQGLKFLVVTRTFISSEGNGKKQGPVETSRYLIGALFEDRTRNTLIKWEKAHPEANWPNPAEPFAYGLGRVDPLALARFAIEVLVGRDVSKADLQRLVLAAPLSPERR